MLGAVAAGTGGTVPFAVGCSAASPALVAAAGRAGPGARRGRRHGRRPAAGPGRGHGRGLLRRRRERPARCRCCCRTSRSRPGSPCRSRCWSSACERSGAVAVKLEDAPTPPKITRLLARVPGLTVYGGLGGVSAYAELARGAAGTMTGFAYPEVLRAVRLALAAGDRGPGGSRVRRLPAARSPSRASRATGSPSARRCCAAAAPWSPGATRGPVPVRRARPGHPRRARRRAGPGRAGARPRPRSTSTPTSPRGRAA